MGVVSTDSPTSDMTCLNSLSFRPHAFSGESMTS